jgi:hypothetical protein
MLLAGQDVCRNAPASLHVIWVEGTLPQIIQRAGIGMSFYAIPL